MHRATHVPGTVTPGLTNHNNHLNNIHMVVPYTRGLSINVKNICIEVGIQIHFKGGDNITQKSGVIYRYECHRLECHEKNIWESARTFGERLKEHLRAPSPIYDHANTSGQHTKLDIFAIVGRESHTITRTIKQAIFIRINDPFLNRNIGK